ncbi:putative malic enzyme, NAPD dependent [Candidatus Zinderia insecticola CARI]|uniref:Putative malic enzyme, NAPD dependent n=1 Tax=Zinderia insecticola (strain CARI) TaxID=871271 RepID=E0TIS3_ZINIC|nr:putative malic enzyme, NAPD dependent [Candidatus Zinderia insecticola CARI]
MKKIIKNLKNKSLLYHELPKAGKISIKVTKKLKNKKHLSLAYSPGVAEACLKIKEKYKNIYKYTIKGNLVGIITNGTAVLGLGNIGPAASKPVMEGKSALFKKFSNIDAFDIEINEKDPDKLCNIIKSLEYTFGGINLEDIKSPECFFIEKKLKNIMNIPIFHDDQHGTAIVVCAAFLNWLKIRKKNIKNIKIITSGAGAAALACLKLLMKLGLPKKNIYVSDTLGIINIERKKKLNYEKKKFIKNTKKKEIKDVIYKTEIFLGLSVGKILNSEIIKKMPLKSLIFALANPIPEIFPEEVKKTRKDIFICTGRSDYKNQVNNLLCFPYIFKGILNKKKKNINNKIKINISFAISNIIKIKKKSKKLVPSPFNKKLISVIPNSIYK